MSIADAARGTLARAEAPSEALLEGASIVDAVFAGDDIIYSCEIAAGALTWVEGTFDETIGVEAIGYVPTLTRSFELDPLYVATTAFGTGAGEVPTNSRFMGRLDGILYKRSINSGQDFGGVARGDGEISINNDDGRLDGRESQVIAGREVLLRVGRLEIPYQLWPIIFRGTARDWTFNEKIVTIAARDDSYRLGVPVQSNLYAGSGGAEGADDLKDKRKPLILGYVINIRPPRVDFATLTYQIHDGDVDAVVAVRDKGVALAFSADYANYAALIAAVIAGGQYATCLAEGFIRLGGTPIGAVTVDAATHRAASGFSTLSNIVRSVIEERTEITRFHTGAFNLLATRYPGDHGIYLDENDNSTVTDVVDELMSGVFGYVSFKRDGTCTCGVIDIPAEPATAEYDLTEVIRMDPLRLPSLLSPPPWRWRLAFYHNNHVQSDLGGAADSFWAQPEKITASSDLTVKDDHPLAQDGPPRNSYMVDASDGIEVGRQFDIIKEVRPFRRAVLSRRALFTEIGDIVDAEYDRLSGRRFSIVVEDEINVSTSDASLDTVEESLYG